MVSINYATREVTCKIVFYGPGLSGKTTNLQYIHDKVPGDTRGKLISLATEADRTLYFDFLPINIGKISGLSAKFQLYTVPGQVYYNATRKLVLRGADGLVFVADSQADKMDENIESLNNMKENLAEYGYDINDVPIVIQYNKRDLPNVLSVEELEEKLNPYGWKYFEGEAVNGAGVFDTLKMSIKLVLDKARHGKSEALSKKEAKPEPQKAEVAAEATAGSGEQPPAATAAPAETATGTAPAPSPEPEAVRESAYNVDKETLANAESETREVGQTVYESNAIEDDSNGDIPEAVENAAPPVEESLPPIDDEIVTTGNDECLKSPEPEVEVEPEPEDDQWGQNRPFPGTTSRVNRRGRRITVSDFQPSKAGDENDNADRDDPSYDGEEDDSYQSWHAPTMAPSTRVKKKKRGFLKRLFGIK